MLIPIISQEQFEVRFTLSNYTLGTRLGAWWAFVDFSAFEDGYLVGRRSFASNPWMSTDANLFLSDGTHEFEIPQSASISQRVLGALAQTGDNLFSAQISGSEIVIGVSLGETQLSASAFLRDMAIAFARRIARTTYDVSTPAFEDASTLAYRTQDTAITNAMEAKAAACIEEISSDPSQTLERLSEIMYFISPISDSSSVLDRLSNIELGIAQCQEAIADLDLTTDQFESRLAVVESKSSASKLSALHKAVAVSELINNIDQTINRQGGTNVKH